MSSTAVITRNRDTMNFAVAFCVAIGAHIFTVFTLVLLYYILVLFFHIPIPIFDPIKTRPKDMEFVLVDNNKPEAPRDKHTKNRAEKMSRSGGKKEPNKAQAVPMKQAGRPTPKPQPKATQQPARKPQPAAARPRRTPRPAPQPKQPTPEPTQAAPTPTPPKPEAPRPPSPKLPRPAEVSSAYPAAPPSPTTPTIKMPTPAANPRAVSSGPVVSSGGPVSSRTGGGSGAVGPQAIPGNLSRTTGYGNSGASGSRGGGYGGGAGGSGHTTQSGSAGGGGGRPGIDAMPEPDFGPYIAELQRRIKRNWNPPSSDRSKRVVAVFTVGRQGQLQALRIKVSSTSPAADDAALAAVRASAPFRPLPVNYRNNSIDIEFIFDYDVYGGGSGRIR